MQYKKSFSKNKKKTNLNQKWQCHSTLNKNVFKRSRKTVKRNVISEIVRSTLSARNICVILFLTAIVLMSIYYKSILIYWQQSYHATLLDSNDLVQEDLAVPEEVNSHQTIEPNISIEIEENKLKADKTEEDKSLKLESTLPEAKQETTSNIEDKVDKKVQQLSTEVKTIETQAVTIARDEIPKVKLQDVPLIPQPIPIVLTQKDKVFFAGDSLMQGVAPYVKKMLFKQYRIESIDLSKRSTGLSYPKAFDWPKAINDKLAEDSSIKLLVIFLGANDPWDFPVKGYATNVRFKSKLWEKQYRLRIASILNHVQKHRIQVLWLAAPCMRKQKLNDGMVYLNKLYKSELEKKQQHFLTTNELLGCSYEKFNSFIETKKEKIKVRVDDGVHFTPTGQKILAKAIMEKIIFKKLEDIHSD